MNKDSTTGNYDMATQNEERPYIIPSLDAGMQMRSTEFLAQKGEVALSSNADPVQKIGALTKVPGYDAKGNPLATYTTTTSTSTSTSTSSSTSSSSTSSSSTTTMA